MFVSHRNPLVRRSSLLMSLLVSSPTWARTIRVPAEVGVLRDAIAAATDGDVIRVAPGEYEIHESISFLGKRISIVSDSGAADTTLRLTAGSPVSDRASVVIFESGEGKESELRGFTISGGRGSRWIDNLQRIGGGGILCRKRSSPRIVDCLITGNRAEAGGGVLCHEAAPEFLRCTIADNSLPGPTEGTAHFGGGVACLEDSAAVFEDCVIHANRTSINLRAPGGGVFVTGGSPRFSRCRIVGNFGPGVFSALAAPLIEDCDISENLPLTPFDLGSEGVVANNQGAMRLHRCRIEGNAAGVSCRSDAVAEMIGCVVTGNRAGGVIGLSGSAVTLRGCTISRNSDIVGGGLRLNGRSTATLFETTISGNNAREGGGIFCAGESRVVLDHVTLAGNAASFGGGVLCDERSEAAVSNSVLWSNPGFSFILRGESKLNARYSNIESELPAPGPGNLAVDPLFVGWSAAPGEVHVDAREAPEPRDGSLGRPLRRLAEALHGYGLALAEGSPCIGRGELGTDMGASLENGAPPGRRERVLRLGAGDYELEGASFAFGVSAFGLGPDSTAILGTVYGLRSNAILRRVAIRSGGQGGVVISAAEGPEISDCLIERNVASGFGGGGVSCAEGSRAVLRRCAIGHNNSGNGGGVHLQDSAAALEDCSIELNSSSRGGGVFVAGGAPVLRRCKISGNRAVSAGGLLATAAALEVADCELSGNLADGGGGGGAVMDSEGTLRRCRIFSNYAHFGGGVVLAGEARAVNCLLYANAAAESGGGLHASLGAMTHCTLTANSAPFGADVFCGGEGAPELLNCIVWRHSDDGRCGNFEESLTGIDPLFRFAGRFDPQRFRERGVGDSDFPTALPDFVLEAPDLRVRPGSAALDAAHPGELPTLDIDGHPRNCGSSADMGAHEDCSPQPPRFVRCDPNGDGRSNIADAIWILSELFRGGARSRCASAADCNDDGQVSLIDALACIGHQWGLSAAPSPPYPHCGDDPTTDALQCEEQLSCALRDDSPLQR